MVTQKTESATVIVLSSGDVPLPGQPMETHGAGPDLASAATAQSAFGNLMDDTVQHK